MRYSINDKTLVAKKARILINALVDCAKAGVKPSFVTNQMLGESRFTWNAADFIGKTGEPIARISDAARRVRESGDKDWKGNSRSNTCARSARCTR